MESQPSPSAPAKFPISVGKCYAQTANERFGDGARAAIRQRERLSLGLHPTDAEIPFTWPSEDDENQAGPESSIYRLVPSMQSYRNNLTALSQVFNLYFVAYQGHIFVYKPRGVPHQSLPCHPDLQLKPEPSPYSRSVGGYLDPRRPHLINHIITGLVGHEEIVLACYDDGDVVAYYTKDIGTYVLGGRGTTGSSHKATPRPFFRENVGMSAWGLAIHQKSRLLAVSSNRHEVIVFALALTSDPFKRKEAPSSDSQEPKKKTSHRRTRNWRIVIMMGSDADNMPNICFVDDFEGQAQKIPNNPHRRAAQPVMAQAHPQIMQLPFGFQGPGPLLDSEESGGESADEDDFEDTELGSEEEEEDGDDVEDDNHQDILGAETFAMIPTGGTFPAGTVEHALIAPFTSHDSFDTLNAFLDDFDGKLCEDGTSSDEEILPRKADMTYFPHSGEILETPRQPSRMIGFLKRPPCSNNNRQEPEARLAGLKRKFFLLRTYEKDIEMRPFSRTPDWDRRVEFGVVCPDALRFGRFKEVGLVAHFHATGRLNMIALAPELALVVIGSPIGRVVLLTLTRKAVPSEREEGIWEHGFRVEWVLPTQSDEEEHRRVLRPMHGMALSPIQTDDGAGTGLPRRYRLMLHYRNHDILSYELTRNEQTGKLCIF
ncbi:uncharacterized protein NECHADRAFT_74873 [Fusarium vanettenii 77-13-4]|uniref:Uncharacterized protein n=1 Tax=Fusarium vanettenii (strain ATCC MYA-4622 / CBS 123669 / FGSC 9596 / NRRL 45880 / 77-13-4) TaxID=660122 RepID=C7YH75_FUSV7|nr:uncharacterized protein NECHADRAFT_74873 [Fusarium vanettenii 77-13-4]EEU48582.1 hypothetical protein NECHADRAFT_74873 [Fusarium vanettenii 77-13-4]